MRHYVHGAALVRRSKLRLLALVAALGIGLVMASPVTAGGKAEFGCAEGFDIGAVTLGEALALPRIQAGLTAGVFTISELAGQFAAIDHNGDGVLCFKDVGALNGGVSNWQYFYNGVDNKL